MSPKNSNCNYRKAQAMVKTAIHVFTILFLLIITNGLVYAQDEKEKENLNVLDKWIIWVDPGSLPIKHLTKQAIDLYKKRDEQVSRLHTTSDWEKRKQFVNATLKGIVGSFPEKGALNAEITGSIQKDGYRIEKIIYEPTPGYYQAGCLYLPDHVNGKAPAILYVSGHDQSAFREEYYQVIITNLVKKGMIVFAIDPLGQGEHVQYYDPQVKFSAIGYSVIEHNYFGNQCFLSGASSASYFIWEGVRAIDYLLTRGEVDPARIGVTGFSGGGTVTAYLSAFDERVKVAVPCSWSIETRGVIETKGVQDNETMLVHGLEKGISFADMLEVKAPKPTLLAFTSRDEYLSIQGARDAYQEAKRVYTIFKKEDNLEMVEDDYKHWMTPKIRLAIYIFFLKHFNLPGNPLEEKTDLATAKELTVTPTGQVSTYKGGKTLYDLNKKESVKLIEDIRQSRKQLSHHLEKTKLSAMKISGYLPPRENVKPFTNGRYQRSGYTVEKLAIVGELENYPVPMLLFKPDDDLKNHAAVIYLHSEGKAKDAAPGGEIEKLVKEGYIVAAVDVFGIGETKYTQSKRDLTGNTAVLIGRSLAGIQAGDIVRVANYLKSRHDINPSNIGAIGINEMCIPLLHAAVFDPSLKNIILVGSPISYRSIAMNKIYKIGLTKNEEGGTEHPYEVDFSWGIAAILTAYDLPDLISCIAPRKVALIALKDQVLEPAAAELIQEELEFPRLAFAAKKRMENLKVLDKMENIVATVNWCFE